MWKRINIREIGRQQFEKRGWEILLGSGEEDEVNATMVVINRSLARRRRLLELRGGWKKARQEKNDNDKEVVTLRLLLL